ncbi:MAG: hypothetical protein QME62_02460 [Armatimonadota bacterium]|nr:hypothetical protein [Armatimonadota bacterium]
MKYIVFLTILIIAPALFADKSYTDYPQLRNFFPFGMYVAAERIGEWDKPEFPTHMGRPMIEPYRRDLLDMARHYINLIAIENTSVIPVPILKQMLAEGEHVGIFTWASENGLPNESEAEAYAQKRISQFKEDKGLLVWSPWDEPYPENMGKWLKWKKAFEDADPNHPVIAVTCGGPKGFENYDVIQASDYYPVYVENPDPWSVRDFVRRYIDATTKPNWFVVQAFQGEGRRLPTVAENRMMTYMALGEGAKGILYFIYDHLTTHYNYPLTPQWEDIGKLGRILRAIGPELLNTKIDRESRLVEMTAEPNIDSRRPKDWPSAVCSILKSTAGHAFVIVYNTSVESPVRTHLKASSGRLFDLVSLVETNISPVGRQTIDLELNPGDGRILLLSSDKDYLRIAERIRTNLYFAERKLVVIEREPAEKWDVKLNNVNTLLEQAKKAVLMKDPKKGLALVLQARIALEDAKKANADFCAARKALDKVYQRLWDFDQALRELREKNPDRWEDKMKWPLDSAISSFLELEHRFSIGDRTVTGRAETLLKDINNSIMQLPK